jgi:hypothetical protein
MARASRSQGNVLVAAVGTTAERLAARLSLRSPGRTDVSACAETVPAWWRQGLASAAVFGDGLISLPAAEPLGFSRPVAFLSAAEISAVAGGEYVPLAWLDGGAAVALVHDRGDRPVVAVAIGEMQRPGESQSPGEPLAESLVAFLDALMPQTVCRLAGAGHQTTIELSGELSLLVEEDGVVSQHTFETAEAVGEFVADLLDQAIEAGMGLRFCSARLRPLIQTRAALATAAPSIMPEQRARAAIQHLVADGRLALEDEEDREALEDLIDDAARFLDRHGGERHLVQRFADWLSQHEAVTDLYADDDSVSLALRAVEPAARLAAAMRRAGSSSDGKPNGSDA